MSGLQGHRLSIGLGAIMLGLTLILLVFGEVTLSLAMWSEAFLKPGSLGFDIVWGIRMPRNLTAAGIGAMLGLSGALLQGLLRNPLAEPGILGVSAGAGLGAAIAVVVGLGLTPFMIEIFALSGSGVIAVAMIAFVARFPQRQSLILLGVGLTSLCGALMALVFNLSPSPIATAEILNWMMGSVSNRNWVDVGLCAFGLCVAGLMTLRFGKGLRYLTLGEDTARSMGINMVHLTQLVVLGAAILAGLSVAVAGIVGFVGLAAPHLIRALGIKDPYSLLLPSALAGAVIVLLADGLIRLLPVSGDLRLGVLTSLLGAPLFALIAWKSARAWMQD